MGTYNCRVVYTNSYPTGEDPYPVIGVIYAKFTYYNGETSVSQRGIKIPPGEDEYLFSRFDDNSDKECVQKVVMAASWLYKDGSTGSDSITQTVPSDECIITTGISISPFFTIKLGFQGTNQPVLLSLKEFTTESGDQIAKDPEASAIVLQKLEEIKSTL